MTNAELLAKIKAEIERLMECVGKASRELKDFTPYMDGELSAYEDILDFLSDLEESKESVPKDLEEAAKEYAKDAYPDKHNLVWMFKRGAKWQAEHTPLPEDTVLFNKGVEEGKRLMMEEAVDAEVWGEGYTSRRIISDWLGPEIGKPGDKIRIIILPKED